MVDPVRLIAYGGFFGGMLAWSVIAPEQMAAIAEEPMKAASTAIERLFPAEKIDPGIFRKYDIVFDESVSTEVLRTQTVRKIAYGRSSIVTIVTTPSGTYSTDGLTSPNVRYPGIEVTRKEGWEYWPEGVAGSWTSVSQGSFLFFFFSPGPADRT